MGKGSSRRAMKISRKQFNENWERVFKRKVETEKPQEQEVDNTMIRNGKQHLD